jgi:hypothetical protein
MTTAKEKHIPLIKEVSTKLLALLKKKRTKLGLSVIGYSTALRSSLMKLVDVLIGFPNYLQLIFTDEYSWLKLYRDPDDRRCWQLDFEHGELQGGGPPSLKLLSELETKSKYKI